MTAYFKLPTRAQGKSYHTPGFVAIFSRQSSRSRSAPRAEWLIAFQAPLSPARPLRSPPSVTRPRTPSTHVHPASTPALSGAHTREFARRPRKRCVARCVAAAQTNPANWRNRNRFVRRDVSLDATLVSDVRWRDSTPKKSNQRVSSVKRGLTVSTSSSCVVERARDGVRSCIGA